MSYEKTREFQSIQSKIGKMSTGKTRENRGGTCFLGISEQNATLKKCENFRVLFVRSDRLKNG